MRYLPNSRLTMLTLILTLTGCAATVSRPSSSEAVIMPATAALHKITLEMIGSDAVVKNPDWEPFRAEWETSMSAAAAAKQATFSMASSDQPPGSEPTIVVRLQVNDFKYVSQAKRYAVGIFSGNAYMDVDAEFIEYPEGKVLGKREFKTSSSAWQGVFSAMTPKQVEAVSQEIVDEIERN